MKTVVIYKSKYGFTETYAKWLAEDLSADILQADKINPSDLQKYDRIICGGGLYAGGVNGISLLTKNFESIKDKSLYLFTVGASDTTDQETIDAIRNALSRVLTPHMLQVINIYHFRGGMEYSKMGVIDRILMSMMRKMLSKKPANELNMQDKMMLETYGQNIDFTDRQTLSPLLEEIKSHTD